MITYPVVEKFVSINGEGQKAGEVAAFIRMRGCNLSCNYCDTSWANTMDCPCEFLSTEELITWLTEHKIKNVTLTGGEPLLTKGIDTFIEAKNYSFPVACDTESNISNLYPSAGIPYTVIVGKDGLVTETFLGAKDADSQYTKLRRALQEAYEAN